MATTAGNRGGERLDRDDRLLRVTGLVFAVGLLLHNADHARRGLAGVPEAVVWGGTVILVLAAMSLTLVFTLHPAAGPVAAAVGLSTAAGVIASHLLPHWSRSATPSPISAWPGHLDRRTGRDRRRPRLRPGRSGDDAPRARGRRPAGERLGAPGPGSRLDPHGAAGVGADRRARLRGPPAHIACCGGCASTSVSG